MILLQIRISQPLVDTDFILSKLIADKVTGIIPTWLITLLESFLPVQMRKIGDLYQQIITKIGMWNSYKLEYPQLLSDNDSIIPKFITDKVMGIFQILFPTLLEFFLTVHNG